MNIDFEYDGLLLSDFGCSICSFDSNGLRTVSAGSQITFETSPIFRGQKHTLSGAKYEECLSTTFTICKNPCLNLGKQNAWFTIYEVRDIMRWLNRKTFCKFRLFDDGYENIHFEGSFNINLLKIGKNIVGMELTFLTNRPYAIHDRIDYSFIITEPNTGYSFYDKSDEIGYIYPNIEITCNDSGTLNISNGIEDRITTILNCSAGEKITFAYPIIQSSLSGHEISNDFNFVFPRISNTYKKSKNVFTFSIPCNVFLSYEPIVKVGV